jgi:hypothetical protein
MRGWLAWRRIVAAPVVLTLVPIVALASPGGARAWADPPAPVAPPAAVEPPPSISVVEASGPTEAPTQITRDTVWGPQGSPYIVRSTVWVSAALTLLPGTVVKLEGGGLESFNDGQILSLGSPQNHVIFTSLRDDTVMGDSNGDGSATAPAAKDWTEIGLSGGGGELQVLDYTEVRYGGWGSDSCFYWEVSVGYKARVIISNSIITDTTAGIGLGNPDYVGIFNNTFARAAGCAIESIGGTGTYEIIGNTF